ncbi:MAG: PEP-CTERM sorting domain-containing protein [Phycisphaerae bacterium]|jgi:hypothetical protein
MKKGQVLLLGLVVCFAVGSASAAILGTATASLTGEFTDGTITLGGVRDVTGYGGFYMLNKTAGTGQGTLIPNGQIYAVCIDLPQNSIDSSYTYDVRMPDEAPITTVPPMGAARAAQLSELWGRYFSQAASDPQKAEAFSAAVWEIVFETDAARDVTSGAGFYCTGLAPGMDTLANSWLASLNGTGPMADLRALTSCDYQDFVTVIPEPATLSLLGLGALAMLRRRDHE